MDPKAREEKLSQIKEQIGKLDEVNIDALSDEELESVAGGCSVWCCSTVQQNAEAVDGNS